MIGGDPSAACMVFYILGMIGSDSSGGWVMLVDILMRMGSDFSARFCIVS